MVEEFFGEYAFFSQNMRKTTARSKNYLEVCVIHKRDFLQNIENYPECLRILNKIYTEINQTKDLSILGIVCYVCNKKGHLSVDCEGFNKI